MLEKLGGAVAMVGALTALMGVTMLNLPAFITALLAFVGVIIYLGGIIFLFSEGTIAISARQAKTIPQVGKTLKGTAS